jgi:hypothetical protein
MVTIHSAGLVCILSTFGQTADIAHMAASSTYCPLSCGMLPHGAHDYVVVQCEYLNMRQQRTQAVIGKVATTLPTAI